MIGTQSNRDRAVSITVTHVLTIGITTILIAMLLTSASTMLEAETDHSTEASLEMIGERLADEISNVDQIADENTTVTATVEHPRRAASSRYTVKLKEECTTAPLLDDSTDCLKLTAHSADATVYVPIKTDAGIAGEAPGGPITIQYNHADGDISITEGSR